jgi:hypothetical protein
LALLILPCCVTVILNEGQLISWSESDYLDHWVNPRRLTAGNRFDHRQKVVGIGDPKTTAIVQMAVAFEIP